MSKTEPSQETPPVIDTYDTNKSYNQLVYGKYIFIAKIIGIVAGIVVLAYVVLINIGHSLKETKKLLTVEEFLRLPEAKRAQFRQDIKFMLLDEMLAYKSDTVLVVVNDPKYLNASDKGIYRFPEERMVYGCKLFALELSLKRTLLEINYPFIYTRVVLADSLKTIPDVESRFTKKESYFPLYITKKILDCYTLTDSATATRKVCLPDSIAAFFAELYSKNISEQIFARYIGKGPCGPYKAYSATEFIHLPESLQQEQRRAFLNLSEAEQSKVRNIDLSITADYGTVGLDEAPGSRFTTLLERKLHELEISSQLSPMFDMATFSLLYPMSRHHAMNFVGESGARTQNSLMLIALKSGAAPSMYTLRTSECPQVLLLNMYADITDVLKGWDQFKNFPKFPMRTASIKGRYFGIPRRSLNSDCIIYRRDWLEQPGVIEWIKKKGWIHPVDKHPYIPFDWTYDDFRTILKLYTNSDTLHKRKGYVSWPGSFLYLESMSPFYNLSAQFLKPNPTRKTTWVTWNDNPVLLNGMKIIHDMFWIDKSVRCGVEVNYSTAQDDFQGGRAGMTYTSSSGAPATSLSSKYSIFGKERPYGEVVGMTSRPGSGRFTAIENADCAITGFNPFLSNDQLNLAIEWIKQKYYGEFMNNGLYFLVRESRTLGSESLVYRDALASPFKIDLSKVDIDYRSAFPPNYVEFYDMLRNNQSIDPPPSVEDFGMIRPPLQQIQDQFEVFFQKVIMDSVPDYDRIVQEVTLYINQTLLSYVDDNAPEKLKAFYESELEYYKTNIPDYYAIKKEFVDKYKNW